MRPRVHRQMASASKVGPGTVSCHLPSPPRVHERSSRLRDRPQTATRTPAINTVRAEKAVLVLSMLLRLHRLRLKITMPPNANAMHASEMGEMGETGESALRKPHVTLQVTDLCIRAYRRPGLRYPPNAPVTMLTCRMIHMPLALRRDPRQI